MLIDDGRAFIEAKLRQRLFDLIGFHDVGNGTPLVEAAATAIAFAARMAVADAATADLLYDDELIDAAFNLKWALNSGDGFEFRLPFGATAMSRLPGGVAIDGAEYVLDSGRAGLHPVGTTRRDAHGLNLERLRELIERKTRRLACRRLGLPSPASVSSDDSRENLHWSPCAEAGGVVLQRLALETGADRFCAAMPTQLAAFADAIVRDMRELWKHRAAIGRRVDGIRRAAQAHIMEEHGQEGPVRLATIAVDMSGQSGDEPVSLYLELDSLDEALRPGRVLDFVSSREGSDITRLWIRDDYASRAKNFAELAALGATGRISDLAAGVAAAAPEGQAAVLARLGRDLETQVVIPSAIRGRHDTYAVLYWRNGRIEAEVTKPGELVARSDRIELRAALPETAIAAMTGRPLSDAVELPFRLSSPVADAEECDGLLCLSLGHGHSLVNCDAGEIWPDADDRHAREGMRTLAEAA